MVSGTELFGVDGRARRAAMGMGAGFELKAGKSESHNNSNTKKLNASRKSNQNYNTSASFETSYTSSKHLRRLEKVYPGIVGAESDAPLGSWRIRKEHKEVDIRALNPFSEYTNHSHRGGIPNVIRAGSIVECLKGEVMKKTGNSKSSAAKDVNSAATGKRTAADTSATNKSTEYVTTENLPGKSTQNVNESQSPSANNASGPATNSTEANTTEAEKRRRKRRGSYGDTAKGGSYADTPVRSEKRTKFETTPGNMGSPIFDEKFEKQTRNARENALGSGESGLGEAADGDYGNSRKQSYSQQRRGGEDGGDATGTNNMKFGTHSAPHTKNNNRNSNRNAHVNRNQHATFLDRLVWLTKQQEGGRHLDTGLDSNNNNFNIHNIDNSMLQAGQEGQGNRNEFAAFNASTASPSLSHKSSHAMSLHQQLIRLSHKIYHEGAKEAAASSKIQARSVMQGVWRAVRKKKFSGNSNTNSNSNSRTNRTFGKNLNTSGMPTTKTAKIFSKKASLYLKKLVSSASQSLSENLERAKELAYRDIEDANRGVFAFDASLKSNPQFQHLVQPIKKKRVDAVRDCYEVLGKFEKTFDERWNLREEMRGGQEFESDGGKSGDHDRIKEVWIRVLKAQIKQQIGTGTSSQAGLNASANEDFNAEVIRTVFLDEIKKRGLQGCGLEELVQSQSGQVQNSRSPKAGPSANPRTNPNSNPNSSSAPSSPNSKKKSRGKKGKNVNQNSPNSKNQGVQKSRCSKQPQKENQKEGEHQKIEGSHQKAGGLKSGDEHSSEHEGSTLQLKISATIQIVN
jgi:hypothetical protein